MEEELSEQVRNGRVGCILVILLMPAGVTLDLGTYDQKALGFFIGRLLCSVLVGGVLALLYTRAGKRWVRWLSLLIPLLPALFISWMIQQTAGWNSPYYAGLNLILLAVNVVVHWVLWQSLVTIAAILAMYVIACLANGSTPAEGILYSNLYFLVTTSVIVIVGNYFYNQLRRREVAARHALRLSQQDLEQSNKQLRELDELKGRFFANISHELRTPLTLLLSPLEALIREAGRADSQLRERLESMRENGMRLLRLINDLLDLVRLDAGRLRLHPERIELDTFLKGLVNATRGVADERGLHLECVVEPEVSSLSADPDKLEKVFLNLLFNAIKFTGAGGKVSLHARRKENEAVIQVTDTGIGIAPEHLPHLFGRFFQADSSSGRKFQGAGLGLALVKELVVAHGGQVAAESELGVGTTITVRLPIGDVPDTSSAEPASPPSPPAASKPEDNGHGQDAPEEGSPPDPWLTDLYRRAEFFASLSAVKRQAQPLAPVSRSKRPHVLVVDDEPDMLRFLSSQLRDTYEIIEAVDGEQALVLAAQYLPDVIVCDYMLPGKDGMEVCRELRAQTATRGLPLLMLTARADDETKLRALETGANDFLSKPFSVAELRARVRSLCAGQQLQSALARQNQRLSATLDQLKETELQLVQAEKMASMGRMSAGIIHEINNPLNYALTALGLLKFHRDDLPPEERAEYDDTHRDIEEGLRRVAHIVGDLREFTHPQGGGLDEVGVRHAAEAALRFLASEWRNRITIVNEIPEDFCVRAVSSKLMQVFVNLLQNAVDALLGSPKPDTAPTIWLSAREHGDYGVVHVRDNGPGIAPRHLDKVFEPFFTTKEVGRGTGLGLSICYRLLRDVGAEMLVESTEGVFCEFRLVFPKQCATPVERPHSSSLP